MLIGVTGYGYTGASAYIDLLREFEDVQSFYSNGRNYSVEFRLLQQPDGINDLRYHLVNSRRRINNNAAIIRFMRLMNSSSNSAICRASQHKYKEITKDYISSLIQISWEGASNTDPIDIAQEHKLGKTYLVKKCLSRGLQKVGIIWPSYKTRYFAFVSNDEFTKTSQFYIRNILESCGFCLDKPVVLEQLFSCSDPLDGADCIPGDIRSIVVDRDPRDIFLEINYSEKNGGRFMPGCNDVNQFVEYFKKIRSKKVEDNRVKYVHFEDLLYNRDETILELEEWLGLKHVIHNVHFKPEASIKNTQLFRKYPDKREEIQYIESKLPEYLYDFEKY